MRGKGKILLCTCSKNRITPAYAGKSFPTDASFCLYPDHPRLCGEKISSDAPFSSRAGSPPPMRGKVSEYKLNRENFGITPAYAGKSRTCWRKSRGTWDHPRLCGEKFS